MGNRMQGSPEFAMLQHYPETYDRGRVCTGNSSTEGSQP
jgi:hypothetical protein